MRRAGRRGATEYERNFDAVFSKSKFPGFATAGERAGRDAGEKAGKSFNAGLNSALVGVGAGLFARRVGQFFVGATQESLAFESAFTGVRKTVQATDAEFERLEDGIRSMSTRLPATAEEIARVAEVAGQLGIAVPDILEFTRVAVGMGEATELSAEEAATALGRIAVITDLPIDQVSNLGSAIADLADQFASNERPISEFATRLAPTADLVGLAAGELVGIAAATTSVAPDIEAAGTAVQRTLQGLNTAVLEGGLDLQKFAKVAGADSAEAFAAAWRDDPARAFASFIEGLSVAGDEAPNILASLGLDDVRLSRTILALAAAEGTLTRGINEGNRAFTENIRLQQEVAKRLATNAAQVELARNRFAETRREIGDNLAPAAAFLAGALAGIPAPLAAVGVGLAGIAAASIAFVLAQQRIARVRAEIDTLPVSAQRASAALSLAGKGIKALAIAGLVVEGWKLFNNVLDDVMDKLRGLDEDVSPKVVGDLQSLAAGALSTNDTLKLLADQGLNTTRSALGNLTADVPESGLKLKAFRQEFEGLDQNLSELAKTAGVDVGRTAAARLAKFLDLTPAEAKRVFDDYNSTLEGLIVSERGAAIAAGDMDKANRLAAAGAFEAAGAFGAEVSGLDVAAEAAKAAQAAFLAAASAFDSRLEGFTPEFGETFREQGDQAAAGAARFDDASRRVVEAEEDGARRIAEARRRLREAIEDGNDGIADAERRLARTQEEAARRVLDAQRALEDARRSSRLSFRDAQQRLQDLETDLAASGGTLSTAAARELRDARQAVADARDAARQSETGGEQSLAEAQRQAAQEVADAQRAVADAHEESAERIADAQRSLRETIEETAERINDAQRNIGRAAARVARSSEVTVASLARSFRTNAADLDSFVDSLSVIAARAEKVADEELVEPFLAHLQDLGPGAAPLLKDLTRVSDTELRRLVRLFGDQIQAGKRAADQEFDKFPPNFREKIRAANNVAVNELDFLVGQFEALPSKTGPLVDEVAGQMDAIGRQIQIAADTGQVALTNVQSDLLKTALATKDPIARARTFRDLLDSIEGKREAELRFTLNPTGISPDEQWAIKAELFARKFHSGIERVPGMAGQNVPALLAPGERVVDADTNVLLTEFLKRSATTSPVVGELNVYEVTADPRVTAMATAEEIGRRSKR